MAERGRGVQQLDFDLSPGRAVVRESVQELQEVPEAREVRGKGVEEEARVRTVSELTRAVRDLLEGGIGETWVTGEISNHRRQASGHHYFTLKDDGAQLACVLFARAAAGLSGVKLGDGMEVEVFGGLTVYEPRGQYQMVVRRVRLRGAGALQARFEELKRRLAAEGLFEQARKRELPRFPVRVGVVTSPTGAAIRDFLNVLHRRHPGIEVVINPVRVQGRGAAGEIAQAVAEFSRAGEFGLPEVDVVVVTRGGGSLEDLWEFNEEVLARAVAASRVPVVSAVGHEIDFTICDFAADVRAATPSAAAEILAADAAEVLGRLARDRTRMERACIGQLELCRARAKGVSLDRLGRELVRGVERRSQDVDQAWEALVRAMEARLEKSRGRLALAEPRFSASGMLGSVNHARTTVHGLLARLEGCVRERRAATLARLDAARGKLKVLDPRATLARGFTITMDHEGRVISSAAAAASAGRIRTRFVDGEVQSQVEGDYS